MKKTPFDPTLPGYLAKLTLEELNHESDRYDQEFLAMDEARDPTPEERAAHPKPRRGRPPTKPQDHAARVLVTMPPALLKRADAFAKRKGTTRAGLIQQALEQVMKRKKSA